MKANIKRIAAQGLCLLVAIALLLPTWVLKAGAATGTPTVSLNGTVVTPTSQSGNETSGFDFTVELTQAQLTQLGTNFTVTAIDGNSQPLTLVADSSLTGALSFTNRLNLYTSTETVTDGTTPYLTVSLSYKPPQVMVALDGANPTQASDYTEYYGAAFRVNTLQFTLSATDDAGNTATGWSAATGGNGASIDATTGVATLPDTANNTEMIYTFEATIGGVRLKVDVTYEPVVTINVTKQGEGFLICDSSGTEISALNVTPGTDASFYLCLDGVHTFPADFAPDTSITVEQALPTDIAPLPITWTVARVNGSTAYQGTIAGGSFTSTPSTRELAISISGLVRLYQVVPQESDGYLVRSSTAELEGTIEATVIVAAGYQSSTPVVSIDTTNNPGAVLTFVRSYLDGGMCYEYEITGFTNDVTLNVSGIVPDAPPPDGGGGGGGGDDWEPPPPKIRVDNQLNENNVSSDTILWPANTEEKDGVSTTTPTDEEIAALLELAKQHLKDVEGLEGDAYLEGRIIIEGGEDCDSFILELTGAQVETLTSVDWDVLTIETPAGSFSLYRGSLAEAAGASKESGGAVRVLLTRLTHGGRPGVDAALTVDGKEMTIFLDAYGLRIEIPYEPAEGEDLSALAAEYIHEDGTVELVTECWYDAERKVLVIYLSHLSKFGVVYRPTVFEDVGPDHWANPYVTFLAARGLLTDAQGSYRPDEPATRADFISLLTRALSAARVPATPVKVYGDVQPGSSIGGAACWLYFNNMADMITQGGNLRPNEAITRQDMAALMNNVASGMGLRVRSRGLDTAYNDADQIAAYAKTAVQRLRAAGILEMPENYKFNPKATLNRGEMAQFVANLLSSL